MGYNRYDVAARLRGLFGGQDAGNVAATARRLAVEEVALRISIDPVDPHPTADVLIAVVRYYAVDPSWLSTGIYDLGIHRQSLADDASIPRVVIETALVRPVWREFAAHPPAAVATEPSAPVRSPRVVAIEHVDHPADGPTVRLRADY